MNTTNIASKGGGGEGNEMKTILFLERYPSLLA